MRLLRCTTVWATVTALTAVLLVWLAPLLVLGGTADAVAAGRSTVDFADLLVQLAAVALAGCAVWVWVTTTVTMAGGLAGVDLSGLGAWAGPRAVRRTVVAACGLALAAGVAAPATAADSNGPGASGPTGPTALSLLDGLPLPERATLRSAGAMATAAAAAASEVRSEREVVVRPGDSLWSIAAATLPSDASDRRIARRWHAVYAHNLATVGADPDLIVPGTTLHLPARPEETP